MKFKVGDVCLVVDCNCRPKTNKGGVGKECTILSINPFSQFPYETDIPSRINLNFKHCWACETCLELKKPPREELGDWELIPWKRPVKETA